MTPLTFQSAEAVAAEGLNERPFGAFTAASTGRRRSGKFRWESGGVLWVFGCCEMGEGVVVRVVEPCDLGAFGGGPDSILALLEVGVAKELNALAGHLCDGVVDVVGLPAEEGERKGREVLDADDADHGSVGFHDDGEGVVAYEAEAEEVFVEVAGAGCVFGGDEGDKGVVGKHAATS